MNIRSSDEISRMYESIKDDYCVSPTAKETLEWVMNLKSTNDCDFLFNLTMSNKPVTHKSSKVDQ